MNWSYPKPHGESLPKKRGVAIICVKEPLSVVYETKLDQFFCLSPVCPVWQLSSRHLRLEKYLCKPKRKVPKKRRKATAPKAEVRGYRDGHFRRTFLGCSGKAAFPIWEKLPSWPRRWLDSPLHLVPVFLLSKGTLLFRAALLLNPQRFFLGGLRLWTPLSALGSVAV